MNPSLVANTNRCGEGITLHAHESGWCSGKPQADIYSGLTFVDNFDEMRINHTLLLVVDDVSMLHFKRTEALK